MKPEKVPLIEKLVIYSILIFVFSLGAVGLSLPVIGFLYVIGALP